MPELRLASPTDAATIRPIYAPLVSNSPISFEVDVPDEQEIQQRIAVSWPQYPWLVCEHAGEVVGYACASTHRTRAAYRWSVDVSVYVHESFRGAGVGRGLYTSLFCILRAQGFVNAFAGIALPNPASVGLHTSFGFLPLGVYQQVGYKLGRWHDVGWWQLKLQHQPASPELPIVLTDLLLTSAWPDLLAAGHPYVRIGKAK